MNRFCSRFLVLTLLVLALVPLLLYAYHGQLLRLISDDYGYLGKALESGTWKAMLFWRENWNGDYSNFLLYGLLAPLGERAPALMSIAFIATGLIGFSWFTSRLLAYLGVSQHRHLAAVALAALIMIAYINGAYSSRAFYWFTASVEYSFPVVALVVCLALGAAAVKWSRSRLRLSLAVIAFAALGFLMAGFSEMYLVFQSVSLALLGISALVYARDRDRSACIVIIAAALAGTAASLALYITSPGVGFRMALTEYWDYRIETVRDLPALIVGAAELMPAYLTNQYALSGFNLLAAAGLAITLTLSQPMPRPPQETQKAAAPWPYIVGLFIQLAFLPYLWSHSSDSRVLFARFSFSYTLVISLNIALIIGAIAMIRRPKRLRQFLSTARGQLGYSGAVLLIVGVLFALPEVRSMVDRAYFYCLITSYLLAGVLLWQLAFGFTNQSDLRAKRIGALTLCSAVLAFALLAVLLAVALRMQGFIFDYLFAPVVFPFVITGLLWGASVGALIRRQLSAASASTPDLRWAGLLSLLVAAVISWNVFAAQLQKIDDLKEGARVWDETHQEILALLDTDPTAIASREFQFRSNHISRLYPLATHSRRLKWREELFYGLDYVPDFS